MSSLLELNNDCIQLIIDKLTCRGIATLRGTCSRYHKHMDKDGWWEYFAERYCDLYPRRVFKRWVHYPNKIMNEINREYGHIYNTVWNKRSLAAFNRYMQNIDENRNARRRIHRLRRKTIQAEQTPSPPEELSELIALCVLKEFMVQNNKEIQRLERLNNKYFHARVGNKSMWRLWWTHGGNETLNELWAINPLSGRPIKKDTPLYQNLQKNGYFD